VALTAARGPGRARPPREPTADAIPERGSCSQRRLAMDTRASRPGRPAVPERAGRGGIAGGFSTSSERAPCTPRGPERSRAPHEPPRRSTALADASQRQSSGPAREQIASPVKTCQGDSGGVPAFFSAARSLKIHSRSGTASSRVSASLPATVPERSARAGFTGRSGTSWLAPRETATDHPLTKAGSPLLLLTHTKA
jgi:hypothetical protein